MLGYVFWHRPLHTDAVAEYEQAHVAFHRSLADAPPAGFRGSSVFRLAELPWLAPPSATQPSSAGPGYEDWYLVDDYTALGVLNEAAVGHSHRGAHDEVARRFGAGAGGLYGLLEGHAHKLDAASTAIWVARPPGAPLSPLGALLGDGIDPERASLWRRQLVLGPAPEFCLLAVQAPAGVAPTRLPQGWRATTSARVEMLSG